MTGTVGSIQDERASERGLGPVGLTLPALGQAADPVASFHQPCKQSQLASGVAGCPPGEPSRHARGEPTQQPRGQAGRERVLKTRLVPCAPQGILGLSSLSHLGRGSRDLPRALCRRKMGKGVGGLRTAGPLSTEDARAGGAGPAGPLSICIYPASPLALVFPAGTTPIFKTEFYCRNQRQGRGAPGQVPGTGFRGPGRRPRVLGPAQSWGGGRGGEA